jgi:hypothetical protein
VRGFGGSLCLRSHMPPESLRSEYAGENSFVVLCWGFFTLTLFVFVCIFPPIPFEFFLAHTRGFYQPRAY